MSEWEADVMAIHGPRGWAEVSVGQRTVINQPELYTATWSTNVRLLLIVAGLARRLQRWLPSEGEVDSLSHHN